MANIKKLYSSRAVPVSVTAVPWFAKHIVFACEACCVM